MAYVVFFKLFSVCPSYNASQQKVQNLKRKISRSFKNTHFFTRPSAYELLYNANNHPELGFNLNPVHREEVPLGKVDADIAGSILN